MSADLHIHIATENITDDHLKCFCSHHMDSKWFDLNYDCPEEQKRQEEKILLFMHLTAAHKKV